MADALTFSQLTESQRQKVADALWSREKPRCQSALVDELVKEDREGFTVDDITNLYPDPSDWGVEKCRDFLRDQGIDTPSDDPWTMTAEKLGGALESAGIEPVIGIETARQAVIDAIDDGDIDGLEDWRDAVRDNADAAEPMEWWEVGDWLAERLEREGEVVIRNGYGDWWGRCCTGQSVTLDSVIQRLGAEYCSYAIK